MMIQTLPFFVYGTLRTGFGNHRTFPAGSITQVRPAHVMGAKMYAQGIPFVVIDGSSTLVHGEVIDVAPASYDAALRALDRLEGYRGPQADNLYNRVEVTVQTADGPVQAYMYAVDDDCPFLDGRDLVPSGDFADHRTPSFR